MPRLSIIVPTYNRWTGLKRLLLSVEQQEYRDFELIIADDGSRYDIAELVKELPLTYTVRLFTHPDEGYQLARVRNQGAIAARGDWLIFIDDDCWFPGENALTKAAEQAEWAEGETEAREQVRGIVHTFNLRFVTADGQELPRQSSRLSSPEVLYKPDLPPRRNWFHTKVMGSGMMFPREGFYAIGGYDETYKGYAGEDYDIGLRFWRTSYKISVICADLFHEGRPTKGGRKSSTMFHRKKKLPIVVVNGGPLEHNPDNATTITTHKE
jgi:glycosyltransferase involved in cell wall biosynthesis